MAETTKMQQLSRYPWAMWRTQALRIAAIDVKRNMLARRAFWIYFLAFAPAIPVGLDFIFGRHPGFALGYQAEMMGAVVQLYYVRLGIFFGCLGIFLRLIRGEMVERSLHFYLLAPIRREVLLIGKFLGGAISSIGLFSLAVTVVYALIYLRFGSAGIFYVFHSGGLGHLAHYLLITVLACLGYGSVFLLLSMFFRNPLPMALLVALWEAINPILPSALQRLSVASYLNHMMPVSVSVDGILALLTVKTEAVPLPLAVLGVLVIVAVVVTYSCIRMRKLEIRYLSE